MERQFDAARLLPAPYAPGRSESSGQVRLQAFPLCPPRSQRISAVFGGNGKPSLGGADEYDTYHSINVSAFLHEADQRLTIVIFNMRSSPYSLDVDLGGVDVGSPYQVYLTTDSVSFERQADLPVSKGAISVSVPAYSAVTVTGGRRTGETGPSGGSE
jgi:hypothetical protein